MIENLRKKIDKFDAKIAKYLAKRFELIEQIAAYKQKEGLPIYDKEREEEHLHMIIKNCGRRGECKIYIHDIFKKIFEESRNIQNNKK